jgi:micrococcal nuclease
LLGWLYVGDEEISLNEQMITEGYAWEYDGGRSKRTLRNSEKYVDH